VISRPVLLALLSLLVLLPLRGTAAAAPDGTSVDGPGFEFPVRLAVTDDYAFFRRINLPPKLDEAPRASGPSYQITSRYWDDVLRAWDDGAGSASESATYYPEGGFVRAEQDGEEVWLVIDLRQQAILNRYIRLARQGTLPQHPTVQQVIAAAQRDENVSVSIGSRQLRPNELTEFWKAFSQPLTRTDAGGRPPQSNAGLWIAFGLQEGRSVQLFYDMRGNRLIDDLGIEAVAVPPNWLTSVLGPDSARPDSPLLAPLVVPQDEPRGGRFWWVVMVGVGLFFLGAAFLVHRRLT
jgi:hypothetical protein